MFKYLKLISVVSKESQTFLNRFQTRLRWRVPTYIVFENIDKYLKTQDEIFLNAALQKMVDVLSKNEAGLVLKCADIYFEKIIDITHQKPLSLNSLVLLIKVHMLALMRQFSFTFDDSFSSRTRQRALLKKMTHLPDLFKQVVLKDGFFRLFDDIFSMRKTMQAHAGVYYFILRYLMNSAEFKLKKGRSSRSANKLFVLFFQAEIARLCGRHRQRDQAVFSFSQVFCEDVFLANIAQPYLLDFQTVVCVPSRGIFGAKTGKKSSKPQWAYLYLDDLFRQKNHSGRLNSILAHVHCWRVHVMRQTKPDFDLSDLSWFDQAKLFDASIGIMGCAQFMFDNKQYGVCLEQLRMIGFDALDRHYQKLYCDALSQLPLCEWPTDPRVLKIEMQYFLRTSHGYDDDDRLGRQRQARAIFSDLIERALDCSDLDAKADIQSVAQSVIPDFSTGSLAERIRIFEINIREQFAIFNYPGVEAIFMARSEDICVCDLSADVSRMVLFVIQVNGFDVKNPKWKMRMAAQSEQNVEIMAEINALDANLKKDAAEVDLFASQLVDFLGENMPKYLQFIPIISDMIRSFGFSTDADIHLAQMYLEYDRFAINTDEMHVINLLRNALKCDGPKDRLICRMELKVRDMHRLKEQSLQKKGINPLNLSPLFQLHYATDLMACLYEFNSEKYCYDYLFLLASCVSFDILYHCYNAASNYFGFLQRCLAQTPVPSRHRLQVIDHFAESYRIYLENGIQASIHFGQPDQAKTYIDELRRLSTDPKPCLFADIRLSFLTGDFEKVLLLISDCDSYDEELKFSVSLRYVYFVTLLIMKKPLPEKLLAQIQSLQERDAAILDLLVRGNVADVEKLFDELMAEMLVELTAAPDEFSLYVRISDEYCLFLMTYLWALHFKISDCAMPRPFIAFCKDKRQQLVTYLAAHSDFSESDLYYE